MEKLKNPNRNIFLIYQGRFPSEMAAALFAAKSCESFAEVDNKVTMLVPRRLGRVKDDPFKYYKIKNNFKVVHLPVIDLFKVPFLNYVAFVLNHITFAVSCLVYLLLRANKEDVIYSNETLPLLLPAYFFKNSLYEVHNYPERNLFMYKRLFAHMRWILVTNRWKLEKLVEQFNLPQGKSFYEPNAVEIEEFDIPVFKEEARRKLNLSINKKLVVYTGHLYSWKGADTLAHAATLLTDDYSVLFVGGTKHDLKRFKDEFGSITNVQFIGHRPHPEVPLWQKAADVLVLPNTAKEDISKYYTSPMKLFEYMASKRPIVASRIPSIVEILNDENAVLVEPDNHKALSDGIMKVLNDGSLSKRLNSKAFKDIQFHSWHARALRIMKEIN